MDSLFRYEELPWGDLIHGTKEQLQQIGIGVGVAVVKAPIRAGLYSSTPRTVCPLTIR